MSKTPIFADKTSGTIAALGTATVTIGDSNFAVENWCITIKNTGGTNSITSLTAKKATETVLVSDSDINSLFSANVPLTAGNSIMLELGNRAFSQIELTIGSTSGTTYLVEWRAF